MCHNHYQIRPPQNLPREQAHRLLFKGRHGSKSRYDMPFPNPISHPALVSLLQNGNSLTPVQGTAWAVQGVWLLQPTGDGEDLEQKQ